MRRRVVVVTALVAACSSSERDGGSSVRAGGGRAGGSFAGQGATASSGSSSGGDAGDRTQGRGGEGAKSEGANGGKAHHEGGEPSGTDDGGQNGEQDTAAGHRATGGEPSSAGDGNAAGSAGDGDSHRTTCDPDPDDTPGSTPGDSAGCKFEGDVVLPGIDNQSGVLVSIVGSVLSTTTDASGHFVLDNVPAGSHALHFRRGAFHETIPSVKCTNNVAVVDTAALADSPIELDAGNRVSDGTPARLAPETDARLFFSWEAPSTPNLTSYVVSRECAPAVKLPCTGAAYPGAEGMLLACSAGTEFNIYEVPRNAADFTPLVNGIQSVTLRAHGHYLAYAKDGDAHVRKLSTGDDRVVGQIHREERRIFLSEDEAHYFFVDSQEELMFGDSASSAAPSVVETFTRPPPPTGASISVVNSPDGHYAAYLSPYCHTVCDLRLLDADGAVRTLGTVQDDASFAFSPDSKFVVAWLDSGDVLGYPAAGGASVSYGHATSFNPTFVAGGEGLAISGLGVSTVLFHTADATPLGDSEGAVVAASPDGHFMLLSRAGSTATDTELVVWDTVELTTTVVESNYYWATAVRMAPDAHSAFFVADRSPSYVLKRVVFDSPPTVTSLAEDEVVARRAAFSGDGSFAFDQGAATLRVALPDSSEPLTLSSHLKSQNDFAWLDDSTLVAAIQGFPPYRFQAGVYALSVPP